MLDMMAAAVIVGVMLILSLEIAGSARQQGREMDRRALAQFEAANLIERVGTLPWNEITPPALEKLSLGDAAKRSLPGAKLTINSSEQTEPESSLSAKRVQVEITWHDRYGQSVKPVRLTKWFYTSQPQETP